MTPHKHRLIKDRLNGLTFEALAKKYKISRRTAEEHLRQIYKELGVHNVGQLAAAYKAYREKKNLDEITLIKHFVDR